MAERTVSKSNPEMIQDEARATGLNLSVLQRYDPLIKQIRITVPHVAMYQFDLERFEWTYIDKKNVEGSFAIVKRDASSCFQIIVVNSCNPGNFVEDILEICEYEVKPPFLMYQNSDKLVRGILFDEPQTCKDVCSTLIRIISTFAMTSPNLKLSPTKSEQEKLDMDPTSHFRDLCPIPSADMTELNFDDSFTSTLDPPAISSATMPESSSDDSFVLIDPPPCPSWVHVHRDESHVSSAAMSELIFDDSVVYLGSPVEFPNPPLPNSTSTQNNLGNIIKQCTFNSWTPDNSRFSHPNVSQSLIPDSDPTKIKKTTNAATISKEIVREVLTRLAMNDNFVEMVYGEFSRLHHL